MSEIVAAILAGGLGTRLRPSVSDRPKPLAQVGGRPFVTYLLDQLCRFRISEVVLCTGYMGKTIESCMGESYRDLHLAYSQEPTALGTAGALRQALPYLKAQQVIVLNGDSYCNVDLDELISTHRERKSLITIAVTSVVDSGRYGTVLLNDRAEILSFKEKDEPGGTGLINAGIYVIDHRVINKIPAAQQFSLEKDVFPEYLGGWLQGFLTDGLFIDIGIPADYERAQQLLPAISSNSFKGELTA